MKLEAVVLNNPFKLVATVLLLLLSCAVFVLAAPSPESEPESGIAAAASVSAPQSIYICSNDKYNKDNNFNKNYQYDGNLVSGSSDIYAYTVDNELNNAKQQQKYNKNNNYVINFERNLKHNENNYKIRDLTAKPTTITTTSTTTSSASNKFSSAYSTIQPTQPAPNTGCNYNRLAVYKVVLQTYWTRNLFPKHYPDWRPTAQWTKTIGKHNKF